MIKSCIQEANQKRSSNFRRGLSLTRQLSIHGVQRQPQGDDEPTRIELQTSRRDVAKGAVDDTAVRHSHEAYPSAMHMTSQSQQTFKTLGEPSAAGLQGQIDRWKRTVSQSEMSFKLRRARASHRSRRQRDAAEQGCPEEDRAIRTDLQRDRRSSDDTTETVDRLILIPTCAGFTTP